MRNRIWGKVLVTAAAAVLAAAVLAFLYYYVTAARMAAELDGLKTAVSEYESAQTAAYIVVSDVKAGNYVQMADVMKVCVPQDILPQNAVTDEAELSNMLYRTDLSANTCLTADLLTDMVLSDDMRELDVVMTEVPIGLAAGDYIDVRIAYPMGQDFIALPHKKVVAINGNVVKLIVEEVDFYANESMKADYGAYQAVRIYGAKYVEAGIQNAAAAYYPVSADILKIEILDPNIDTGDFSNTLKRRRELEEQLIAADLVEKNDKVTANKERLKDLYEEAERVYAALQEEKERKANQEAGQTSENLTHLN